MIDQNSLFTQIGKRNKLYCCVRDERVENHLKTHKPTVCIDDLMHLPTVECKLQKSGPTWGKNKQKEILRMEHEDTLRARRKASEPHCRQLLKLLKVASKNIAKMTLKEGI